MFRNDVGVLEKMVQQSFKCAVERVGVVRQNEEETLARKYAFQRRNIIGYCV